MTAEYAAQVEVMLVQLTKNFESSMQTGDHLDNKAATLLQASSIVTGLTGVIAIPAFASSPSTWVEMLALGVAFATFVGMILCALLAWSPSKISYPGGKDWDTIFPTYIAKDLPDCMDQLLADTLEALRLSMERNTHKSRMVRISGVLFAIQIVGLFVVASLST